MYSSRKHQRQTSNSSKTHHISPPVWAIHNLPLVPLINKTYVSDEFVLVSTLSNVKQMFLLWVSSPFNEVSSRVMHFLDVELCYSSSLHINIYIYQFWYSLVDCAQINRALQQCSYPNWTTKIICAPVSHLIMQDRRPTYLTFGHVQCHTSRVIYAVPL